VGIVAYFAYRNLLDPNYSGGSSVDRSYRLTLSLPYPLAFQRCLESLSVFGRQSVLLVADPAQGRIEAALVPRPIWRTFINSWGWRIDIRLGSDQEGTTEVVVTSKAPLTGALFGSGANERNVKRVAGFLEKDTAAPQVC
jgi:hypothetical protein